MPPDLMVAGLMVAGLNSDHSGRAGFWQKGGLGFKEQSKGTMPG